MCKRSKVLRTLRLTFRFLLMLASKNSLEKNFTTRHQKMHNYFDYKICCDALLYLYRVRERKFLVLAITALKGGDVGASESYLLHFSPGSFEDICLIESCRELDDVSFEIRLKYLK